MPDIFLSYCREDQIHARRFAEGFEREGFSVWWDQSLTPGEAFDTVTEQALESAGAVVVLWSKHAVDSRWVRAEATQASVRGTLVPVMIEPCKRPIMFELTHTADLAHWKGDPGDGSWRTFVAGVRRIVGKNAPTTAPAQRSATPAAMPSVPSHRGVRAIAAVLTVLLLAGTGAWWIGRSGDDKAAATATAAVSGTAAAVPALPVTLAVLPFADLSAGQDQSYFSDGLTEELLNQLAQVQGLRVTARTSSFSFKGKNEDVRVISEKLGVANLLEGSVRKEGTHLRITAQLIHGEDGGHLWSKTYARELSDVFALQEEVAKDVARALSVRLDVGTLPRLHGGTNNVEAYDKYLQARGLYLQGGPIKCAQAAVLLRDAVKLDPKFSRAWLLRSQALAESLTGVPDREAELILKERAEATRQVMDLAPDSWWAQAQLANAFIAQRQWAQAEAAVHAGAAPSANYEENGPRLFFLGSVGRMRELVQRLEEAKQLDPLSFAISGDLQIALDQAGRPEQAQVEYERSLTLPGIYQRANIYTLMRILRRDDATPYAVGRQFRKLLDSETLRMEVSHALAENHTRPEKVREIISQAIDDRANQDRVRMAVITLYADAFKHRDLALLALERSVINMRNTTPLWFAYRPGLRADPRYKALLRATGLVDYFRASGNWGDFCKPVGADDFECT
jgi:TolB-like protein